MNRFYYSRKQEYAYGANMVFTNGRWIKFTEWITQNRKSNFDDAILILETEEYPMIKISEEYDSLELLFKRIEKLIMEGYSTANISKEFDIKDKIKELDRLIDNSLDKKDKEAFSKYTKERNCLMLEI